MRGLPAILALSLVGALLAGAAAWLVRRLGQGGRDRPLIAAIGLLGLLLAGTLPFAWVRLFGGAP